MAYSGGVSRGLAASSDGSPSTSSRNQPFQFRSPWLFAGRTVLSSSCDVICPVSPLCVHSTSAQVRLSRRTSLLSRLLSASPCCCCTLRISVQTLRPRPAFSCPCSPFFSVVATENCPCSHGFCLQRPRLWGEEIEFTSRLAH